MTYYSSVALAAGSKTIWERLSSWYQSSLLHELLTYLQNRYFRLEFDTYENISIDFAAAQTVQSFIIALCFGIIAAAFLSVYVRIGLGGFVHRLLKEDCTAPERAKGLLELGFFRSPMIRRELSRGVTLRKVVYYVPADANADASADPATNEATETTESTESTEAAPATVGQQLPDDTAARRRLDLTTARFYIPEDLRYRAELRFRKKGSGWLSAVLVSILALVAAGLIITFLPKIIGVADAIITLLAP